MEYYSDFEDEEDFMEIDSKPSPSPPPSPWPPSQQQKGKRQSLPSMLILYE